MCKHTETTNLENSFILSEEVNGGGGRNICNTFDNKYFFKSWKEKKAHSLNFQTVNCIVFVFLEEVFLFVCLK